MRKTPQASARARTGRASMASETLAIVPPLPHQACPGAALPGSPHCADGNRKTQNPSHHPNHLIKMHRALGSGRVRCVSLLDFACFCLLVFVFACFCLLLLPCFGLILLFFCEGSNPQRTPTPPSIYCCFVVKGERELGGKWAAKFSFRRVRPLRKKKKKTYIFAGFLISFFLFRCFSYLSLLFLV